jgi:hypothetical protein
MCVVVCARIGWWCYSSSGRLCTGAARADGSVGRERWEGRTLALSVAYYSLAVLGITLIAVAMGDGSRQRGQGEHVEMSVRGGTGVEG